METTGAGALWICQLCLKSTSVELVRLQGRCCHHAEQHLGGRSPMVNTPARGLLTDYLQVCHKAWHIQVCCARMCKPLSGMVDDPGSTAEGLASGRSGQANRVTAASTRCLHVTATIAVESCWWDEASHLHPSRCLASRCMTAFRTNLFVQDVNHCPMCVAC